MMYKKISLCLLWLTLSSFFAPSQAKNHGDEGNADHVMEHLLNEHTWKFAEIAGRRIVIHLPIIVYRFKDGIHFFSSAKFWNDHGECVSYRDFVLDHGKIKSLDGARVYDISVTKNVASMLMSMLILLLIFLSMARRYKERGHKPRGIWMLIFFLINFVRKNLVQPNIDKEQQLRLTPYLLTLFFFIWLNNFMGLLPGGANVTGNFTVTFVLASATLLITTLHSSTYYWKHIFNPPGVPKWAFPIIVPVEVMSIFTKPVTLMIRLFANMLAGHLVLLNIICLLFTLKSILAPLISVPLGVFMFAIKLVVAFFQAYIFVFLFASYLGTASHRPSISVDATT